MKTKKTTLDHFYGNQLNRSHLKHTIGGRDTVPPQGDPGDIKDPVHEEGTRPPITTPITVLNLPPDPTAPATPQ
jgi:hypothetical protein